VLRTKPGALAGSTPLAQWRQMGRWPACFDQLWQAMNQRLGRAEGTLQMINLLDLGKTQGWDRLRRTMEQALAMGCHDSAAIQHLLMADSLSKPTVEAVDPGFLARYERPMPVMTAYDQLLSRQMEATA